MEKIYYDVKDKVFKAIDKRIEKLMADEVFQRKNGSIDLYGIKPYLDDALNDIKVVEEEKILKFYYVRSLDDYWIGRRIDNFYYAEYDAEAHQWVWTHSRYLPWGKHVVEPSSLWKEYTYPSEPEEMPFGEWLEGFIKKYARNTSKWECQAEYHGDDVSGFTAKRYYCSKCKSEALLTDFMLYDLSDFCPHCGADMRENKNDVR